MMRYLIYIFLIFCLTATANAQMPLSKGEKNRQKEYIKEHGDMDPQRTIEASPERIRPLLTLIMTQAKYIMDSETPSQLVFSQELTGMRGLAPTLLLGNSYSETPKRTLRFILVEQNGKTLVNASGEISVRMALGNVNKTPLDNKTFRAEMQALFDGVDKLLMNGKGQDQKSTYMPTPPPWVPPPVTESPEMSARKIIETLTPEQVLARCGKPTEENNGMMNDTSYLLLSYKTILSDTVTLHFTHRNDEDDSKFRFFLMTKGMDALKYQTALSQLAALPCMAPVKESPEMNARKIMESLTPSQLIARCGKPSEERTTVREREDTSYLLLSYNTSLGETATLVFLHRNNEDDTKFRFYLMRHGKDALMPLYLTALSQLAALPCMDAS